MPNPAMHRTSRAKAARGPLILNVGRLKNSFGLDMYSRILLITAALFAPFSSFADTFGSDLGGSWADTPKGRFECRNELDSCTCLA